MTTPTMKNRHNESTASTARLLLLVACIWPFCILALFAASAPNQPPPDPQMVGVENPQAVTTNKARLNLRNMLDRVDIMGYGPTHPRLAVVIAGEDKTGIIKTVESVFENTDLNRIFVIVALFDGHSQDPEVVRELEKIDSGSVPHWHGLRPDIHLPGSKQSEAEEDDPHGRKIHIMFNEQRQGITSARKDATDFVQLLVQKHEAAGLKSQQEDLILLMLQPGVQLIDRKWLVPVTNALIVPPPLLGAKDESVAMKLANAVSFNLEGPGKRTSFDEKLAPVISEATASDINQSSGMSYPTPAFNGAAIAMRLDTFLMLPAHDETLMDAWPADLELSLNLWLCGDGIDILNHVEITTSDTSPMVPLEPELAAHFAAAWMDPRFARRFFQAYSSKITMLEWETLMAKARRSPTFPKDVSRKCRSFAWFVEEINSEFGKVFEEQLPEEQKSNNGAQQQQNVIEQSPPPKQQTKPEQPVVRVENQQMEQHEDQENVIPQRIDGKKPSKPLCPECLEIVQQASPVDISFVDMSNGHTDHPHMGAKDEHGNFGYIHDETALRRNPPLSNFGGSALAQACNKRDNNYRMLREKVFVDLEYDRQKEQSGVQRDKIFCLVYTIDSGHPKIPLILETWGPKCDGFMVGSNKTDVSIGAVNIPHEGAEEYDNIWQKVRSMWSYIYDNYYEKYDWFHIGGDDLYLIVENLRYYLESEEIKTAANGGLVLPNGSETSQTPLFLGRRFAYQGDMNDIFISGGSGYTMNKATLKLLVTEGFPNYFPHAHTFSEDTMVARILRKFGVYPYITQDEHGGERYMPFQPGHHFGYRMPEDKSKDWYARYSINIKEGLDHCAARSVAFHYIKGPMMHRLHALLYHQCPADTLQ